MPGRRKAHRRRPGTLHKSHLISLSADIEVSVDLLGKTVEELQSEVSVSGNIISGTLNKITDYTGFSGDPEEQSGHYLAVKCTANEGDTIILELIGGRHGPVTLDEDGICIIRLTDPEAQSLKYTAVSADGSTEEKTYLLTGLTLAE